MKRAPFSVESISLSLYILRSDCINNNTEAALRMKEKVLRKVSKYCDHYITESMCKDLVAHETKRKNKDKEKLS